ncbi:D-2-hydroxyacid dehydrogenase [candidate division KSB1 bacterium]|nr:D-2-hydroxyacid dehydrogenase [candidate division KSB1 bacterium]
MNIVILDAYTINPGDLSWNELEKVGNCTIYEHTPQEKVVERTKNADIALINKTGLYKEEIDQLPDLKYIGVLATGYNVVDVDAAKARKIPITNVPAYSTMSVVQMVFAHLLNYTQRVAHHDQTVKEGRWTQSRDFCYWDFTLIELADKTLGIVGFGRIGRAVARVARALGMHVLAVNDSPIDPLPEGVKQVDFERVFKASDFITLHCPLNSETLHLINKESLSLMSPDTFLINTGRGALIDEHALADALNQGLIAGAGLDVLEEEPASADSPLLYAKNCTLTPHIAWATREARARLINIATDNVKSFLEGNIKNRVG